MQNDFNLPPLGSISPECSEMKYKYDDCFIKWFPRFLKGDLDLSVCDKYLKDYQACVKAAVKRMHLDVPEENAIRNPVELTQEKPKTEPDNPEQAKA